MVGLGGWQGGKRGCLGGGRFVYVAGWAHGGLYGYDGSFGL